MIQFEIAFELVLISVMILALVILLFHVRNK